MTGLAPITDRGRYYQCLNAIEGYSGWAALGITNINIVVLNTTWTEPSTGGGGTNPGGGNTNSHILPQADPDLMGTMEVLDKLNRLLQNTPNNVYIIYTATRPDGCDPSDAGRTFYDINGNIGCYIFENHLPTLYEEIGHAFQFKNHPHDLPINREMEVKMMVYDFCKEQDIEPFGDQQYWETINNYSYGCATANEAKEALMGLGYSNANEFDPDSFHMNNLNELRN